jgi:hypothetical protein
MCIESVEEINQQCRIVSQMIDEKYKPLLDDLIQKTSLYGGQN